MTKYELTDKTISCGVLTLRRIRAVRDFCGVKAGDYGGYIEDENNLSQDGNAWVFGNARVSDNACMFGNARVSGDAKIQKQSDYLCIGPIGSRNATTTFYQTNNGIYVACGCFNGTIDEFAEKVKETHKENKHAVMYELAIELAKAQIVSEVENGGC
jgi:hypothetical protein